MKQVGVHGPFVDEDVLREFRRIVVQEIAESVYRLGDGGCKESIMLWKLL